MNKRLKKKKLLYYSYELKNINGSENCCDNIISHSGELYKGKSFLISFYEHPLEGGYYPNGEPTNKKEYYEFLSLIKMNYFKIHCNNVKLDEFELFHKGITELMNKKFMCLHQKKR